MWRKYLSVRNRQPRNSARSFQCETLEARQLLTVVISEFMADNDTGIVDSYGNHSDWIELRNSGNEARDVSGWYLTDDADDLSKWRLPSITLDADEHLLIFASGENERQPGAQLHTNFKLSAGGEYLALVEADASTVASEFAPAYPSQTADVSYGQSVDLGQVGFFLNPTPDKLNSEAPIADASQGIVINELMYNLPRDGILDAENIDEEFIELHNQGTRAVDLTGWNFTRGVDFTFGDTLIPAGGYLVVAANVASFQAKYPGVENVVGGWTGQLANNGETIELVNSKGVRVDKVRYASEGDWSVRTAGPDDRGHTGWIWNAGHDGNGMSMELINPAAPNDVGQNWTSSATVNGTPAAANSALDSNVAPFISDVLHSPAIPQSGDSVTVTATLTDEESNVSATLHWRVAGAEAFSPVAMNANADGTFAATIPAHADRTVIEFYVQAVDAQSQTRNWPAPTDQGEQVVNALYQVMDDFDLDAEWDPNSTPIYFQVMTPAERDEFGRINRQSDAQFNTTFIAVDGTGTDVIYNTGVRIRGSASRNNAVPNNRLSIPNDRLWNGLARVNINAANPANQVSGAALFRLAGVETADAHGVRMFSNGVDLKGGGYYAHVEVLDSDYASNHFPHDADGTVYRGRRNDESPPGGRSAGLAYNGPDPAPYVSYVKNTNASKADWSDVINLTNVLNNSPPETFVEDVRAVADVGQWFRAFAMNSLLANNEYGLFTGDPRGDDYAMYVGVNDPRFLMLPYDLDSMYTDANFSVGRPLGVPALRRLIEHPEFRHAYYAQFLELTDSVLLSDEANEVIDNSIGSFATENRINQTKDFLRRRAANIRNQISQALTVTTNGNNDGQYPRLASPDLTLSGQAPTAFTQSVAVNGISVDSLAANQAWSLSASSVRVETTDLFDLGATWKYLDDGTDQGVAWREPDYDDSGWASGPAELGYGDGDEATVIEGGPNDDRYPTSYFRRTFDIENVDDVTSLQMRMKYDDGIAVFINGVEVVRENLVADAAFDTYADGSRRPENGIREVAVSPDSLVSGVNSIAVEIHQHEPDSSDVSFDMELKAIEAVDIGEADTALRMFPGLNRYTVEAFDGKDLNGSIVESEVIDVWYDTPTQVITGSIAADAIWTAEAGPYEIDGNVVIPDGVTLTISPGTSVFFRNNARLTINGRLNAVGVANAEVRFTRLPNTNGSWNGLQFRGSMNGSRIDHAIIEYGVTGDGMIGLENSELTLNHVTLDNTDRRRIRSINSSLVVRDSVFENIFDPGQAPTTDNQSEHIWGRGIPDNGQWILERNVFGHITGHNDSVDFDAPRLPGPIPIIRENTFVGGGDDALDMTGDVWIEGNKFQNFIKDEFNVDPGESNTISASEGTFWVIGNTFTNVQHASLVKENSFSHFINNTVVSSSFAPLYFDLPGQTSGPGRGALVQNSIFNEVPVTFDYVQPDTDLTVEYSFLPAVDAGIGGVRNQFGNPHIDATANGAGLLTGSRAKNAGKDGQDLGSAVPLGAIVVGEPTGITSETSTSLHVGGPTITHYRYRVNGGTFSNERSVGQPIELSNLADGSYVVEVVGKNVLGMWQAESEANSSGTWIVDRGFVPGIRINEVLAAQNSLPLDGEYPDLLELHNPASTAVNIGGFSLSDDSSNPDKFVLPAGTVIGPGEYLTIIAGESDSPVLQTGFGLSREGDELYLYDNAATRTVVDSITFGRQLDNLSIGRLGGSDEWGLTTPTFGTENVAEPVNDAAEVVINEWYANGEIRIRQDFIELYNPTDFPAGIGGHYLTDKPFAVPDKSPIAPLSFIAASGHVSFVADGEVQDGPDHVGFRLSPDLEQLGFFGPDLQQIDFVFSYPQTSEMSQGRVPDGAAHTEFLPIPSPAASNASADSETIDFGFSWDESWSYNRSGEDIGTTWRAVDYNDAEWEAGPGPLGNEREQLPIPIATEFELASRAYYFRRSFEIDNDINLSQVTASIETQVDDGFVVYLNGVEVVRQGMPDGEILFDTLADRNVNEARLEGPFALPVNLLRNGENVFAVEVHQVSDASGDMVFALAFNASETIVNRSSVEALVDGLRVSEVMFNHEADGPLDYVEVQNISDIPLELTGIRLAGGVEFEFPSVTLAAGEYAVVAEDAEAFIRYYGQSLNVVGQFSGQLSDTGEEIVLKLPAPNEAAILRFDYDAAWAPEANGQGRSLEVVDTTLSYKLWDQRSTWAASEQPDGTPGYDANSPAAESIVINEVLSHTDLPQVDSIELHNRSDAAVDVGGWYLSDSGGTPQKFQIPQGTVIQAGGYFVFDENDFNSSLGADPNDFALSSSEGETLWLWEAVNGQLLQVVDSVQFGAAANGETFGRVPNGTGAFYPLAANSLGQVNGDPRVGSIILSEVNYHPADPTAAALMIDPTMEDDDLEFVEIYNSSTTAVDLTDWRIRRGIDFDFAEGTSLPAGGTLVIVSFDPVSSPTKLNAFRTHYGLSPTTRIVGGFSRKLDNGDDVVQLQRPDGPPAERPDFIPRLIEDEIRYDDADPWPASADGAGNSLTRTTPAAFGNDPASWSAVTPTPGNVTGATIPGDLNGDQLVDVHDIDLVCSAVRTNDQAARFNLNNDAGVDVDDMFYLVETIIGSGVGDANLDGIFNSTDFVTIFRASEYEDAIAGNSTWAEGDWNCDGDFSSRDLVTAFQRGNYVRAAIGNHTPAVAPADVILSLPEQTQDPATSSTAEAPMHVVPGVHQANDRSFEFDDRAAAVESVFAEYDGGTTSDDQNLGSSRDII